MCNFKHFFPPFCSCILHELFISPTFSLTSKNIKTQLKNKAAKYKVFCISCHRRDLLWCHWDLTFSCLEQCFSTVVLDVAGCPIFSSFLERKLMGEWSEREAGREEEKKRTRTRLPHACQYYTQSQFSRDGQGGEGASQWQPPDPQNQDFKGGEASHSVRERPPPAVIYISLGHNCLLATRRLNTHTDIP